jgi:hypothetical protein
MNETASKKKAASKKTGAAADSERGRPRIIRLSHNAVINEQGQVELFAKHKQTVHGLTYLETHARILKLPPGTFFIVSLYPWLVTGGVRMAEQLLAEEAEVSILVHSEVPIIVREGERLGFMQPVSSARMDIQRGEHGE